MFFHPPLTRHMQLEKIQDGKGRKKSLKISWLHDIVYVRLFIDNVQFFRGREQKHLDLNFWCRCPCVLVVGTSASS